MYYINMSVYNKKDINMSVTSQHTWKYKVGWGIKKEIKNINLISFIKN